MVIIKTRKEIIYNMYNEVEFTTNAAPLLPETVANNKTIKEYAKYQMNNLLLYKFVREDNGNWRQWSQEEVNQYNNNRQKIHQYETAEEARARIEKAKAAREKKAKLEQEYDDSLEFDESFETEEEIKRAEALLEALRQSLDD